MKTLNSTHLQTLIDSGYIVKNKHPEANLWIYNYSPYTQYERNWNEYTLLCRGLILDEHYNIVARPLPKFFNMEELDSSELPQGNFEVYEKMDGSLGILYWHNNQPYIATRGSFTSKQAMEANTLLQTTYKDCIKKLDRSKTYIFEIIYPENRIVVDYGKTAALVLLAIVDTATGNEIPITDIGFPLPKSYHGFKPLTDLKQLDWNNQEGFIIKYDNNKRLKIKFENYLKIHKVVTQISSISIWEQLQSGGSITRLLENTPDEFYTWVKETEQRLRQQFRTLEAAAQREYKVLNSRKETALYFQSCKHTAILFAMYTGKKYDVIIWRSIRPKFEKAYTH